MLQRERALGRRPRLFRQANQHLAEIARPGDPLRKIEPQGLVTGLQIEPVRIEPAAPPLSRGCPQKASSVKTKRILMVGIHVLDRALFGFQKRSRIRNFRQKLRRLEIHNPPESGHQMGSREAYPTKGEILEVHESL